jgi:hypothetical protein
VAEGWVCVSESLPLIKWFSPTDASSVPLGIKCVRVDKHVAGVDWKTWAGWFKLARYLSAFPF